MSSPSAGAHPPRAPHDLNVDKFTDHYWQDAEFQACCERIRQWARPRRMLRPPAIAVDGGALRALSSGLQSGHVLSHLVPFARGILVSDGPYSTAASRWDSAVVQSLFGLFGHARFTVYAEGSRTERDIGRQSCYRLQGALEQGTWKLRLDAVGDTIKPASPWAVMQQILRVPVAPDAEVWGDDVDSNLVLLATAAAAQHYCGLDRLQPRLALLAWHVASTWPDVVLPGTGTGLPLPLATTVSKCFV